MATKRALVRKELIPFLEVPRGKRASLRDQVLARIEKMVDQKDKKTGRPTEDAQRWWRWIIERTDPVPGKEGAGNPGQVFTGPVQVVLTYEGKDPPPRSEDLPPIPSLGPSSHPQERTANERGAMRAPVRKDNPRRA